MQSKKSNTSSFYIDFYRGEQHGTHHLKRFVFCPLGDDFAFEFVTALDFKNCHMERLESAKILSAVFVVFIFVVATEIVRFLWHWFTHIDCSVGTHHQL